MATSASGIRISGIPSSLAACIAAVAIGRACGLASQISSAARITNLRAIYSGSSPHVSIFAIR